MHYNDFNPMMPFTQQNQNINQQTQRNSNQQASRQNSQGSIVTPPQQGFDNEQMIGSIQKIFADNVGEYVLIEFLIGTDRIMRKQGIIYFVGNSYIILYDDTMNNYIMCDIFSVKFVYFYYPGERPRQNFNLLSNPNASGSY